MARDCASAEDATEPSGHRSVSESRLRSLKDRLESNNVDFVFFAHCMSPHFLSDLLCARALGRSAAVIPVGDPLRMASESGALPFFRLRLGLRIVGSSPEFGNNPGPEAPAPTAPSSAEAAGPLQSFDWKEWFETRPASRGADEAIPEAGSFDLLAASSAFQERMDGSLRRLRKSNDRLRKKLASCERALETVRGSVSFRIGRFLTRPFALFARR